MLIFKIEFNWKIFLQPSKSANGTVNNESTNNRKEAEQASIELDEAGKDSQITAMEDTNAACTCERIDNFFEVQEADIRKQEGK